MSSVNPGLDPQDRKAASEDRVEVPYRFERSHTTAAVHRDFPDLPKGTSTGVTVSVAGRLVLSRPQGKLAFATLRDSTGTIQLFALAGETADFRGFCDLSLGEWIGARGEVVTTKRGELSVKVSDWVLLAHSSLGFGDKWRGVTDLETRYRQREMDLWANPASRDPFLLRSHMISLIRRWLEDRGFLEVETPMLHGVPSGGNAHPFVTHHRALDLDLYLRIAPELYLKRLVVGGFEKVFEIGRSFRNEGLSPRHNPEFTMLELYDAYGDYTDVMVLVEDLVSYLAIELVGTTEIVYQGRPVDLTPPWRRAGLIELVGERLGEDLGLETPLGRLAEVANEHGVSFEDSWGPGKLLLEIYEKLVEPELWDPVFVCDYPVEVSPLARDHRDRAGLVERFEVIVVGRELANAFSELVDPIEQRKRFEHQMEQRARGDEEAMTVDEAYLRALERGLPPTAGLGIGIDRLAMLLADVPNIRDVILFPTMRPDPSMMT